MTTLLISIIVLGAAVAVVLYLRWAESNAAKLAQRDATLLAEQERRHATEKAEAEAAAARKAAFDEKARNVHDTSGAIDLLREAGNGTAD